MKVEVVRAFPERVEAVTVELPAGATLRDAVTAAKLNPDPQKNAFGIFGRRVSLDHPLADGDRVEIYRPLAMDPKEARRLRAKSKLSSPRRRGPR
jgi:putative ubiquitin-RnfH superfamily antitoxin RatB of RatAB toxin-antitoxin module